MNHTEGRHVGIRLRTRSGSRELALPIRHGVRQPKKVGREHLHAQLGTKRGSHTNTAPGDVGHTSLAPGYGGSARSVSGTQQVQQLPERGTRSQQRWRL